MIGWLRRRRAPEPGVRITDLTVPGPARGREVGVPNRVGSAAVPVRVYEPPTAPWATLVWAHGGSFVRGTLDWPEADWVARRFAEAGMRVTSVDYALAGEAVRAPAPSADVAAVLDWVAAQDRGAGSLPLVMGGASAGAHLAVLAALHRAEGAAAGDGRAADALILEYPTLHRVQRADAAISAATAGLPDARRFGAERIAEMYAFYLGSVAGEPLAPGVRVAGELPSEQLGLLPPTVLVHADADDLRASGEQFAEQLRAAGVAVAEFVQPGTVHGYMNRPEEHDRARADAHATIARFVAELRRIVA
ncbi:alpha/beta hydrolase [Leucobacter chromiireducens]|uniref:alpha/beta hydrolase n=1 Tax=Leucobacter chromiireducens TaxID=283877 RepID=UPI000F634720|nr:alpha/beta hydrolase [Leucobacter chromiireducens]